MPDDCCGTETNDPACLLNAPAKIDVVPGLVVLGIKTADAVESPTIERHVTARDVLGHCVRKQNVTWTARRRGDACLNPILRRGRDVWAPYPGVVPADKRPNQIIQ